MATIEAMRPTKAPGRRNAVGERKVGTNYRDFPVRQFQGPLSMEQLVNILFPVSAHVEGVGNKGLKGEPRMYEQAVKLFDEQLTEWARIACEEWGFKPPSSEFFEKVTSRLPEGLRATIGSGLEQGLVIPQGYAFRLKGLAPSKGPYRWFSRYSSEQRPNPNWEYYVQVAEYVRLSTTLADRGYG
jgi:hypothetical protein